MEDRSPRGRKMLYSLDTLKAKINDYFNMCDEQERPYTVTGLCVHLKISRDTLLQYENLQTKELQCMDKDKQEEFTDTIKDAKLRIHNYAEEYLFKAKNPAGVIFNLKNNWNWVDKQEISSTIEQKTSPIASLSKEELLKIAYSDEDNDN